MDFDLDKFIADSSKSIAEKIMQKYDEDSILTDGGEEEIYKRSLHEATGFYLQHDQANLEKEIEELRFFLSIRVDESERAIKKLKFEELLGNSIKVNVVDILAKNGFLLS